MAAKKSSTSRKSTSRRTTNARSSTRGGTSTRKKSSTTKRKTTARKRTTRRKTTRQSKPAFSLNLKQKALIVGIGLIFVTALIVLSLLSPQQGQLTSALARLMWTAFGWGGLMLPVALGGIGFYLVLWGMDQHPPLPAYRLAGIGFLFITFEAFASLTAVRLDDGLSDVWAAAQAAAGGGYFGALFAGLGVQAVGTAGTVILFLVLGIIAAILALGVTREDAGQFFQHLNERRRAQEPIVTVGRNRAIRINPGRRPATAVQPPLNLGSDDDAAETAPVPITTRPATNGAAAKPEKKRRSRRKKAAPPPAEPVVDDSTAPVFVGRGGRSATQSWSLPLTSEILESGGDQDVNSASIREQVEVIEHTLESFGAPAKVVEINQGPTITQFGVEPSFIEQRSGKRTKVKVGKIAGLADDLALALAARSIRIQAPVPGKGYVGIEVPNSDKALVSLRDVMESAEFQRIKSPLRIGLGQNVAGQPIATDLATMPHLLIAGTTGSGKSVCVNGIIACLLLQNTPDDLKLVLVDPKRVELTGYNGVPHLAAPVVVDMERVIGTLQWAMREMDNRYKLFADVGARNIIDYNKKIKRQKSRDRLPYIVIVIDELADLMMLSPEETERGVTRLAQMARATGIHMVIATQRPSVDVVTGLIKANFPARVAFAVASSTDSRVILDTTGAERLLGQGDMLFQSPDAAAPIRMQGCFVSDQELQELISYWQTARRFNLITTRDAEPTPEETPAAPDKEAETIPTPAAANGAADVTQTRPTPKPKKSPEPANTQQSPLWEELQRMEEEAAEQAQYDDELMPEAIALVRKLNKASTSLLQRRFRIGYTRAARLIDAMEDNKIIGPPTGTSKARIVIPWQETPDANPDDIITDADADAEE